MTTWLPSCCARIARRAAARIFSALATLVPPNFCTINLMNARMQDAGFGKQGKNVNGLPQPLHPASGILLRYYFPINQDMTFQPSSNARLERAAFVSP